MVLAHHRAQLSLEHLDDAFAVGGTELLEERARLADLASERLCEHAVLGAEILLEQTREDTLVIDEGLEPLAHLSVARIEEAREHGADRGLLLFDVGAELAIDVGQQRLSYVLQLRLLRGSVGVAQCAKPDAPCVERELIALRLVELAEEPEALGARVANLGGNDL
ncbi:MAG: hypothetical protein HYS27_04930 [Deltaproteobacteria bacterium]|nr:hypothetical protein [Deltaproteobacteria bacterium]